MLDPGDASVKDLTEAIENRDQEIRAELVDFVRGQRVRVDVTTRQTQDKIAVAATPPTVNIPSLTTEQPVAQPPVEPIDNDSNELAQVNDDASAFRNRHCWAARSVRRRCSRTPHRRPFR
jgi:hypothetical protein